MASKMRRIGDDDSNSSSPRGAIEGRTVVGCCVVHFEGETKKIVAEDVYFSIVGVHHDV